MTDRRLSQEVVEAPHRQASGDVSPQLSQEVVEAPHRQASGDVSPQLSQEVVEAPHRQASGDVSPQLTQIVIEVPRDVRVYRVLTQLVIEVAYQIVPDVFPDPLLPSDLPWSPAYNAEPGLGGEVSQTGYYGPAARIFDACRRAPYSRTLRR